MRVIKASPKHTCHSCVNKPGVISMTWGRKGKIVLCGDCWTTMQSRAGRVLGSKP